MVNLEPDCANCAALCCVALAFDQGEMFGFDKAAGEACRHLDNNAGCEIHSDLAQRGFTGCVAYQCDGAGQRVVQALFNGRTWRDHPADLKPMLTSFSQMRAVHAQLVLIKAASELPITAANARRLAEFDLLLQPSEGWTKESLGDFVRGPVLPDMQKFWRSLTNDLGGLDAAKRVE